MVGGRALCGKERVGGDGVLTVVAEGKGGGGVWV